MSRKITIAFGILLLSLAVRLCHISEIAPYPDELLWEERSYQLITNLRKERWDSFTSHLKHPGIPPAAAMAIGEYIAEKLGATLLSGARIANGLVSSILPSAIFWLSSCFISLVPAALAGILLALDPTHIELSRSTHLDSIYSLLVGLTVLTFAYARIKNRKKLMLLAGLLWGLCISTKPTAATLALAFLLFQVFQKRKKWFDWHSIWAVLIGHYVLGALFTRLWTFDGNLLGRLKIKDSITYTLHHAGIFLNNNLILAAGIAFIAILLLQKTIKEKTNRKSSIILFLSIFIPLSISPAVVKNLYKFWLFTAGLSKEIHQDWGFWQPPEFGYLTLLWSKMPSISLIILALGLPLLIKNFKKRKQEEQQLIVLLLLCIICWIFPLSFTSKQVTRYILPCFSLIYLLIALSLFEIINFLSNLKTLEEKEKNSLKTFCLSSVCILTLVSSKTAAPDYHQFFNSLSGGLKNAKEKLLKYHPAKINEALEFMHNYAKNNPNSNVVANVGQDIDTTIVSYQRLYPKEQRILQFKNLDTAWDAALVYNVGAYEKLNHEIKKFYTAYGKLKKELSQIKEGVEISSIYSIPQLKNKKEFDFTISDIPYHTGRMETDRLRLLPNRHKKGFALLGVKKRVLPDKYYASFELSNPNISSKTNSENNYAVRLKLGGCLRIIRKSELEQRPKKFVVRCSYEKQTTTQIRVYWFGNTPVEVSSVKFGRY